MVFTIKEISSGEGLVVGSCSAFHNSPIYAYLGGSSGLPEGPLKSGVSLGCSGSSGDGG